MSGEVKIESPIQVINSEMFHPTVARDFESWPTLKALLNNSHKTQENITVRHNGHLNQCDQACMQGYELCVMHGFWPRTWLPGLYQLNSKLWLTFLSRIDPIKPYFEADNAFRYVAKFEKEWIEYDVKLVPAFS